MPERRVEHRVRAQKKLRSLAGSQEERRKELESGVLSTVGMRISRAGVSIAARRAHVWLGAAGGPPAVRKFPGLAHFHATAPEFGFGAMAIAAARRGGTEQGWRVCEKRQRAGEEAKCGGEKLNGKLGAQECSNAISSHELFCAGLLRKTDSAVCLGVLLPGFWNLFVKLGLGRSKSRSLSDRLRGRHPEGRDYKWGGCDGGEFRFES